MTTDGDTMAEDVALRLRALAATRWVDRSDAATRAALLEGADEVERLRGLLDARTTGDGALLDRALSREASLRVELAGAQAVARGAQYREREALAVVAALRAKADGGDAGDLAGLGRREAGEVRRWRGCHRCGRCFLLADDEAVPGHGVRDAWGADRACGAAVTVGEGSEGR